MILSTEKLEGKKKKKQGERRINSLRSSDAEYMQQQHFQADYLETPIFNSIFNPTATGSVTASVLRVILFL